MWAKTIAAIFTLLAAPCIIMAQTICVEKTECGDKITLSVPRETNIFSYVFEGADDSLNFEIIGVIKAKGYSMFALSYDFMNYDKSYRNYRVKQINMSGNCLTQTGGTLNNNYPLENVFPKSTAAKDSAGEW
jgi:hypothetical protein